MRDQRCCSTWTWTWTYVTPPRLTALSVHMDRTEIRTWEYAAMNDTQDRVGAVVMRVAFDRGTRWGFGGVLLQPRMDRLEG
jgi:hypothetical protein